MNRAATAIAILLFACTPEVGTGSGDGAATTDGATRDGSPRDGATASDGGAPDAATGPRCKGAGTFCGGHGITGGDPNILYYCGPEPDSAPGSWMICANGCEAGAPDACKTIMPMGNAPVCPGGGDWCGSDMVANGDPNTLYHCSAKGVAPSSSVACPNGCQTEPLGTNDLCKGGGPICPGGGDYCGSDGVTGGDVNTLYHCPGKGQPPSSSMACASGCHVNPMGVNDVCTVTLTCPGAGDYCGADGVQGGDGKTLYHCPGAGQPPSSSVACPNGCQIEPQGVNDLCVVKLTCPGPGDFCGNDGIGGPANVLYHCNGGGQAPASSSTCQAGCAVQKQGVNDFCNGGGCNGQGQTALNWEANQLNTGHPWSSLCLGFVNNAYQAAGNSPWYLHVASANDSLNDARTTGKFVNWNGSCPCGAILYWSANNCNGEWGHVVICNGDGTASTSGWNGFNGNTHASITWLDGQECGRTPAGYIIP